MATVTDRLRALEDGDGDTLLYTVVVANTALLFVLLYGYFEGRPPTLYWLVPVVWFTVGAWGLLRTPAPQADTRTKRVAGTIAGMYFLVLAFAGGLVGPAGGVSTGLTVEVLALPPGWNPAILYSGAIVQFALVPFTAFGYAVLSYLVYVAAIEAKSAVAGGIVGLFSCVSCTLPVIAAILGGAIGGGAALTSAASAQTYLLGTAVFVLTVVLLSYRPGLGWLRDRLQA